MAEKRSYTFNQIVQIVKTVGQNHAQINSVEFCTLPEMLNRSDVVYPAMCFECFTASVSAKTERYPFTIWLVDMALPGEHKHITEIRSDMLQVSNDIVGMLMDEAVFDFTIDLSINRNMFDGGLESGDGTVGVAFDLTISQPFRYNRCEIPNASIFSNEFNNNYA